MNQTNTPGHPRIEIRQLFHRGENMLALHFPNDPMIKEHLLKLDFVKWSQTHQCYYVLHSKEIISRLINHCRGIIWVDLSSLKNTSEDHDKAQIHLRGSPTTLVEKHLKRILNEAEEALVRKLSEKIILRGYSPSTLKNYRHHIRAYLSALPSDKNPVEMTKDDIEQYLLSRQKTHPTSESDINIHINAIKFLYEQVLGKERMLFYLPQPEKPLILPKVLGEHELERLFRAVANLKHKAILLTAFSCGLRVSEVIHLRLRDIDSERMQVLIERSKGKKDRYVTLSPVLLDVLRKYVSLQKPRPKEYLFEGQREGQPYSAWSAQAIFNRAVVAAGIHKKVTFHALRHSYATHLLEKGVDIKYIKELLGHFDIKTTERYLHVAREKLVHIQSPLDFLDRTFEKRKGG